MPSVHEQLSEQFYKWESRGRGWQVFDQPIYPEPPFQAFSGYQLAEAVDDGRRPTFLSSLFRKISQAPPPPVIAEDQDEEEPEPTPLVRDSLVEFQASLPDKLDVSSESFNQFFHNLALCREPIAFELMGTHKRVLAQFVASVEDASPVRKQLSAHFPDVQFRQLEGALGNAWDTSEGEHAWAVDFGLEREFMLPLASGKLDPFIGMIGALAELQPGELGLFQVLWQPVQHRWAESILRSVTQSDGKPLFLNSPELAGAAENKVARPLFAVVVRILVRTASTSRLQQISRELAGSLRVFINPQGNALIPLHDDDYPFEDHIKDVLCRQTRRSGMILNSEELTGFVHLPSSAVRSPALQRDSGRTKAAPDKARLHYREQRQQLPHYSRFVVLLGGSGSDTAEVIRRRHAFFIESVYPHIRLQAKDSQRLYDPLAKEVIWIRDGRKCKNPTCGREVTFSEGHIHHIIEHTAGGKTKLDNGILVCPECHGDRANMQALTPDFQNHIKQVLAQNQFHGLAEFA